MSAAIPATRERRVSWAPIIAAMVAGAAAALVLAWRVHLQAIDRQMRDTRAGVKKLTLSGKIPPNESVKAYFAERQTALEQGYQRWVELATVTPLSDAAASSDPQVYAQEQYHDIQRTLERSAAARSVPVPELLGFPKEIPPSDAVPRLLGQLALLREAASLIFERGVSTLWSFKLEEPQPVAEGEGAEVFLTRLPIRVRAAASLPQLLKVLDALQRAKPIIDVHLLRVVATAHPSSVVEGAAPPIKTAPTQAADMLDVELLLTRYLLTSPLPAPSATGAEEERKPAKAKSPKRLRQRKEP